MNGIDIILKYIAGNLSVAEFENELYTNKEFELVLLDLEINWRGTYINTNLYHYLIGLNYSTIEGKVNSIGALKLFLEKKNIQYSEMTKYERTFDLILSMQPKYIDASSDFIEKFILPQNFQGSESEMKKIIRANYQKHFKYQNKPPKWIQSPKWIIKNDKPLFFIGQLELKSELFHDNGFVYVFVDTETREIKTVQQFL